MDAIEALDEGVYAHFDNQIGHHPEIAQVMMPAYHLSSYVGVAILFTLLVLIFLVQGKRREAVVALFVILLGVGLVQGVQLLVPRPHPANADKWIGAPVQAGTYPSAAVFLFTLGVTLLGMALWDRMRLWLRGVYILGAAGLVVWICMAGFFLAFHYLTDVIGGLAGAALVGWIASRLMPRRPKELVAEVMPPPTTGNSS
jgi:membrane-associated phospholipid phosphatase